MAMEIVGLGQTPLRFPEAHADRPASPLPVLGTGDTLGEVKVSSLQAALTDLEGVSMAFNRRLKFSVNSKIDQVVVKVIDQETDTVIKEIPPKELQIVHERIREALGLLFDERI